MLNLGSLQFTLGVQTRALDAAEKRISAFGNAVQAAQTKANRGLDSNIGTLRKFENALLRSGSQLSKMAAKIQAADISPNIKTALIDELNHKYNALSKSITTASNKGDFTKLDRGMANFSQSIDQANTKLQAAVTSKKRIVAETAKAEAAAAREAAAIERASIAQQKALASAIEKARNLSSSIELNPNLGGSTQAAQLQDRIQAQVAKMRNLLSGPEPLKPREFMQAQMQYSAALGNIRRDFSRLKAESMAPAIENWRLFRSRLQTAGSSMLLINGHLGGMSTRMFALGTIMSEVGVKAAVVAGAFTAFGVTVFTVGKNSLRAALEIEKVDKALIAITGSTAVAATQFNFLRDVANKSGQSFLGLSRGFSRFLAASEGAGQSIEQTQTQYRLIAQAAGQLSLSVDDTQGVMRAFEQILSKGNVQAEELRGQLGDRLPGAFSIAAKAMGVTEGELNKLLKAGKVISRDFIPAFTEGLREAYNLDVDTPIDTLNAAMQRAGNALTFFYAEFAKNTQLVAAAKSVLATFTSALGYLEQNLTSIIRTTAGVTSAVVAATTAWLTWSAAVGAIAGAGVFLGWLRATITLLATAKSLTEAWTVATMALNGALTASPWGKVIGLIARVIFSVGSAIVGYKLMTQWIDNSSGAFDAGQESVEQYIDVQRALGFQIAATTEELIKQQRVIAQEKANAATAALDKLNTAQKELDEFQKGLAASGSRGYAEGGTVLGYKLGEVASLTSEVERLSTEAQRAAINLGALERTAQMPTKPQMPGIDAANDNGVGGSDAAEAVDNTLSKVDDLIKAFNNAREAALTMNSGIESLSALEALQKARDEVASLSDDGLVKLDGALQQAGFTTGTLEERLATMLLTIDKSKDAVEGFRNAWGELDTVINDLEKLQVQLDQVVATGNSDFTAIENYFRALRMVQELDPTAIDALLTRMVALGITLVQGSDAADTLRRSLEALFNQSAATSGATQAITEVDQFIDRVKQATEQSRVTLEGMRQGLAGSDLSAWVEQTLAIRQYAAAMESAGVSAEVIKQRIEAMQQAFDEDDAARKALEAAEEWRNFSRDAGREFGIFAGNVIKNFKDIGSAVDNLLSRLLDLIIELTIIQPIMDAFERSMGGGGGFFGLFKSGGYTGNGSENQIAGAVHGKEYVINAQAVRKWGISTLDAINNGRAVPVASSGGGGSGGAGGFGSGPQRVMIDLNIMPSELFQVQMRETANDAIDQAAPSIVQTSVKVAYKGLNRKGITS